MNYHIVSPAYGRDYKSAEAAVTDWKAGMDFKYQPSGQYCSKRDFKPGDKIEIRYSKMMKLTIHTMESEPATIIAGPRECRATRAAAIILDDIDF